ncbi:MAG: MBL fold metallo-hydrolase [Actinobacteria bacterium]|nr:MBL fold metallo-hydrolase [Actinomycetota bacterium]MSX09135.1 MBL fold metallo-hydrolase [Actinomycetota bacterium]MSX68857.1 MBL fold metallo-hydrolase [Actinomycetota bacterium]
MADRFYFRQLLSGRDFAHSDPVARQMVNFAYAIGDRVTGEALLVDPAYGIDELMGLLAEDDMVPVGVLASHYHADHIGGDLGGYPIEGIAALLERVDIPIHVNSHEVPWIERTTGVTSSLRAHDSGDVIKVGEIEVELVHTPGHTPGSQCFLTEGHLLAGDTLFLEGCGRTDLPGSDPGEMYETLTKRLSNVPDDTVLFPGHLYSAESSQSMGQTRKENWVLAPRSPQEWLAIFG